MAIGIVSLVICTVMTFESELAGNNIRLLNVSPAR